MIRLLGAATNLQTSSSIIRSHPLFLPCFHLPLPFTFVSVPFFAWLWPSGGVGYWSCRCPGVPIPTLHCCPHSIFQFGHPSNKQFARHSFHRCRLPLTQSSSSCFDFLHHQQSDELHTVRVKLSKQQPTQIDSP